VASDSLPIRREVVNGQSDEPEGFTGMCRCGHEAMFHAASVGPCQRCEGGHEACQRFRGKRLRLKEDSLREAKENPNAFYGKMKEDLLPGPGRLGVATTPLQNAALDFIRSFEVWAYSALASSFSRALRGGSGETRLQNLLSKVETPSKHSPRAEPASRVRDSSLGRCERELLRVLVARDGKTTSDRQLAIMSGYRITSGGFKNALASLRSRKYLAGSRGAFYATEEGSKQVEGRAPQSGEELLALWLPKLGKCERVLLDLLVAHYPAPMDKDALSSASGYSVTSGGFKNACSRLRTLELIEGYDEMRAASDFSAHPL
jgi:hypothetical protein